MYCNSFKVTPRKLTWQWNIQHWKMYFPLTLGFSNVILVFRVCHGMSRWKFLSLNFFLECWDVVVFGRFEMVRDGLPAVGLTPVFAKFIYIWTADRYDGSSHLQNFSPKQRSTKLQHAFSVASLLHMFRPFKSARDHCFNKCDQFFCNLWEEHGSFDPVTETKRLPSLKSKVLAPQGK